MITVLYIMVAALWVVVAILAKYEIDHELRQQRRLDDLENWVREEIGRERVQEQRLNDLENR